jgi:amidase
MIHGIGQTNCLTEIFIERALERAARLDEYFKKTGKTMGPLHGMNFFFQW